MSIAPVRRWIDRWNAYWFPVAPTLDLAICRIVAVGAQLLWFFPDLGEHTNLLVRNTEFIEPQLIVRIISAVVSPEVFFTPGTFTVLYWATMIAGVAALVGFFTRTSLFLFALGSWVFVAHLFSYGDRHHTEALFCIFLMLLGFAPSGERLSVDALLRRRRGLAREDGRVRERREGVAIDREEEAGALQDRSRRTRTTGHGATDTPQPAAFTGTPLPRSS